MNVVEMMAIGGGKSKSVLFGREVKEGDWPCQEPGCANINFSKRTKCNRCGAPKPKEVIPEEAVHLGGPPGLFKKGDWACSHCGNINWARRDKCNICNAPKPVEKSEPRTGRGGGHYDLQDPADRNTHKSDDEDFDEFGRRKRKKQNKNKEEESEFENFQSNGYSSFSYQLSELKLAFPPAPTYFRKKLTSSRSRSYSSRSYSSGSYSSSRSYSRSYSRSRSYCPRSPSNHRRRRSITEKADRNSRIIERKHYSAERGDASRRSRSRSRDERNRR